MSFRWIVLGAGAIVPRAGHGCAGHALLIDGSTRATLFDCGPGTLRQLPAAGIDVAAIERVVLSHFHPDHCLDLLALAFARRNPELQARLRGAPPLELVGPVGLSAWIERAGALGGERGWTRFDGARVIEVDVREGLEPLELGGLRLRWAPTRHTPDALAWRAQVHAPSGSGASVVYSGDSGPSAELTRLAAGADVFVCECSFDDADGVEHHLTPSGAARIAREAQVGKLVLTHFYPSLDPRVALERARGEFAGIVEISSDGSVHSPAQSPRSTSDARS